MRRLAALVLLLVAAAWAPAASCRETTTINAVTIDGDIRYVDPNYIRDDAGNDIYVYYNTNYRGFIEWNISAIPDGAIIEYVYIRIRSYSSSYAGNTEFWSMENRPSAQANTSPGNKVIYDDARDGTKYYTSGAGSTNTWYTFDLGSSAAAHLQSRLSADWFAVGMHAQPSADAYYASETAYDPELKVLWHLATDYRFTVGNPVYENSTDAGSVTVHATGEGFADDYDVSTGTTLYFPVMPQAFSWDIGGGASRMLFTPEEENFTVTLPEAANYVYQFTMVDYTGKLGLGQAYLEAWRSIGGAETLVTRMPITQPNPVPMNLVYGRTYHMQVLFADGSRYDWGYYVPAGSFSATIVIRGVEFTDQAQLLYNHIHVEAQRVNATYITVNYLDDRNATVWANVTIRVRGGAVVLNSPHNASSYTVNWASADPDTGYVVTVAGLHDDYGQWGYSRIFDQPESFPPAPNLTGISDLGLGSNLLGWIITVATVVGFSVRFQARGLLAGAAVASVLTYIGWASFDWDLQVGLWVIAIIIALGGGEK